MTIKPEDLIHELAHAGLYACSHDEVALDAKVPNPDQIKLRFGKSWEDRSGGPEFGMVVSISGDILTGGGEGDQDYPRRSECWRLAAVNEEPPGWPAGQRVPVWMFCLHPQATPDAQDGNEVKALYVTAHGIWSTVPIYAPNLTSGGGTGPGAPIDKLVSADGRYELNAHSADAGGMLVYYDHQGGSRVVAEAPEAPLSTDLRLSRIEAQLAELARALAKLCA
jgi:hypothetical protein